MFVSIVLLSTVCFSSAYAQESGADTSPILPTPVAETSSISPVWIDAARLIDTYRIPEKVADLRGITTDPTGANVGFYFSSSRKGTFAVYRNGRRMQRGVNTSMYDLQEPTIFRMTASGDLLYDLHGTDLYVNATPVSLGAYMFSLGVSSVHEHGGLVTFPEHGKVVAYAIARNTRTVLYQHEGEIQFMRRAGGNIAYTVLRHGRVTMYRNGRIVSAKDVDNPTNFALSRNGDVYFFSKVPRGYALYRNARPFVTGKGNGAYVDIDPEGHAWHLSHVRTPSKSTIHLRKDRSVAEYLPAGVANAELYFGFLQDGYALRASFLDDPSAFYLIRDGAEVGDAFFFDYPYNDRHGFIVGESNVIFRGFDGERWRATIDGTTVDHPSLKQVFFLRMQDGVLTIYATK